MSTPAHPYKDHFSGHAQAYASARPRYPADFFASLAGLAPGRALAWDAGTGNGQAAMGLAGHFECVVATDPSGAQLANAQAHPRISYRIGRAEASGLSDRTVDLVSAAQAVHWFDIEGFWREATRVLRPGGVVAVWCYGFSRISPAIDALVERFYHDVVGPFWPPERRHIETGYRNLPFPFAEYPFPAVVMESRWTLEEFMAYVGTWSAVQGYREQHAADPLVALRASLGPAWEAPQRQRRVSWHLSGRVGHLPHP